MKKAKNCLAYLKEQKERFEDDYEKKYSHILASIPNLASDGQSGKDHISKVVADQTTKHDLYKKELEALVIKLETHTTNHKSAPPSNETAFGVNNSTICQGIDVEQRSRELEKKEKSRNLQDLVCEINGTVAAFEKE